MTHVILTGAAGFAGSHMLRHLLVNTDWTIACPVSFRHKGLPERIVLACDGQDARRVNVVRCDLSAPVNKMTRLEMGTPRVEYVFNYASESHVDRSIENPVPFVENNVSLMLNVLEMCRYTLQLKALIHVSTDEIYGPALDGYHHAEWDPILPSNPYSASKAAMEAIANSYWRTYGIPLIVTNTMNLIGEAQGMEKFVPMTISRVLKGQTMTVHASPEGRPGARYYLHARNQSDALLFLSQRLDRLDNLVWSSGAERPPRYNVKGEREVNNLEMAQFIAKYVGKELHYELVDFHSSRPGHDLRYALDGTKLKNLGWKAPLSFDDSLERTVHWTMQHPKWMNAE